MARKIKLMALESILEIDKLKEKEKAANKSGEFDLLYQNTEAQKEAKDALDANQDTSLEDPSEPVEGDSDPLPEGDGVSTDEDTEAAIEHIRTLTISQESFYENASQFISGATDLVVLLGTLGIRYSGPVLRHVFKGVAEFFGRIAKMLYSSMRMLTKYMTDRNKTFTGLKGQIEDLKKTLNLVNQKPEQNDLEGLKFTQLQAINTLKSRDSVDFTSNIGQLTSFVDKTIKGFSDQIHHENNAINHIMSSGRMKSVQIPNGSMRTDVSRVGLSEGTVSGYETNSEYVDNYRSTDPLPADVVLIVTAPKTDIVEKELLAKAFNDSSFVLGFDTSAFKTVEAVDYMNSEQLAGFLDQLDKLCDVCISHDESYEKVRKGKEVLKISLRNYFTHLSHSDKKVPVGNSFIDLVALKILYIDKVYLTGMIDVHDYVSKVIVAGTRFAKKNLEQLS